MQEAADDLIRRVLCLVMAVRAGGCSASRELAQDLDALGFLHELGAITASGDDIRARIFG